MSAGAGGAAGGNVPTPGTRRRDSPGRAGKHIGAAGEWRRRDVGGSAHRREVDGMRVEGTDAGGVAGETWSEAAGDSAKLDPQNLDSQTTAAGMTHPGSGMTPSRR